MSSYIYFYIRGKKELVPVYESSRSSEMYRELGHLVPYNKVRAIPASELNEFIAIFENEIESFQKEIAHLKDELKLIPSFQNDVNKKLEAIESIEISMDSYEEEIAAAQACIDVLRTLRGAIETIRYNDNYYADKYVYAGIECWCPPLAVVEKWERGEDVSEEEYENLKHSEN